MSITINAINKWYDGVQEPWRFLLAMALCMTGIVLLACASLFAKVFGAIFLLVLVYVRMRNEFR